MNMDKYQLLKDLAKDLNQIADAKGITRCGYLFHAGQCLDALEKIIRTEEEGYTNKIREMQKTLDELAGGGEPNNIVDIPKKEAPEA